MRPVIISCIGLHRAVHEIGTSGSLVGSEMLLGTMRSEKRVVT